MGPFSKKNKVFLLFLLLPFSLFAEEIEEEEPSLYERALEFVLEKEGGFVNHPSDRGGATNYGITQATYNRWRKNKEEKKRSVKHITDQEVEEIYQVFFWIPSRCPEIAEHSERLAIVHFDWAVNSGQGRAMRTLQSCIDTTVDSIWGPKTKKALREAVEENEESLLLDYLEKRREFYRGIAEKNSSQKIFLQGWMNRVSDLEDKIFSP